MNQLNFFEYISATTPIRWAGRKTKLLNVITGAFQQANLKPSIYYEPFFGSGSLFFSLKSKQLISEAVVSDFLPELEIFYKTIKNRSSLKNFDREVVEVIVGYNKKRTHESKTKYYKDIRDEYNLLLKKKKNISQQERVYLSALFYFLNRTGFNGLYRKNTDGEYNVPHGRRASSKNQNIEFTPQDIKNLENISLLLKNTLIKSGKYQNIINKATNKDFIYMDPPYVDNFVDYTEKGFSQDNHIELSKHLETLRTKGVKFLFSNSNTDMTKEIFFNKNLFCYELEVTRTIERRKKEKDGRTTEVLVSPYKLNSLGKSIW